MNFQGCYKFLKNGISIHQVDYGTFVSVKCFIPVLFVFIGSLSSAQIYPYQNYSVKDGLINSNVCGISEDSSGYIWFATENGLSRFNGIEFENYSLSKLGINSYISSICSYNQNTLYFGCGINGLYKFNSLSGIAERINKVDVSQSNQIIIKNELLISLHEYHNFDFLSLSDGFTYAKDSINEKQPDNKALSMKMLSGQRVLLGRSDGLYEFINGRQHKLNVPELNDRPVYSIHEGQDRIVYLGSDGVILKLRDDKVIDSLVVVTGEELRVRNIIIDNENDLWFNVWGTKDIYMISGKLKLNVSDKLNLKNASASHMMLDKAGNLWAGTLGKGVFLFSNMYLRNYPTSDELPSSNIKKIVKTENGTLLLGTNDGIAFLNSESKVLVSEKHIPQMTQFVRDITSTGENNFVVAITDIRLEKPFSTTYSNINNGVKIQYSHGSSLWSDSSELWVGNWDNSISQYQLPEFKLIRKLTSVFSKSSDKLRINTIIKDRFNHFWIGSQKGFCVIKNDGTLLFTDSKLNNHEITSIKAMHGDTILIVTNNGFMFFKNDAVSAKIKMIEQIDIDNTSCVSITGQNEYLVGTKYGLYYLSSETKKLLNIHDGMLSDDINDMLFDPFKKIAYVATSEGLLELDINKFKNRLFKKYQIDDIYIHQQDTTFRTGPALYLPHTKSSFTIKYHTFNYSNPYAIKYEYSLDNGNWIPSPSKEIQFASLEHGEHIIKIRAGEGHNSWGPAYYLKITIEPPFYRTLWFYILTAIGSALLLFVFIRRQLSSMRIKQEEKSATQQKLVELQQKALASNLNPHFIFNSLNSIQHFINSHNPAEANDYLSKFSRLMRMQLNMADKSFITLHEEITRLEFYLSLEQMRFGEKLTWQITIDPKIDPYRLEIPNMIIQPFIENAIWHGIMPSAEPGNIHLNIQLLPGKKLEITVIDNGVGYGQHKSTIAPSHESKGVKLITDRLNLLDPDASNLLVFENNHPGTKVTIQLTQKMYRIQEKSSVFN